MVAKGSSEMPEAGGGDVAQVVPPGKDAIAGDGKRAFVVAIVVPEPTPAELKELEELNADADTRLSTWQRTANIDKM